MARLDEMTARLDAMVRAVKSLRPTLATFYASLSDEQKAQFNNMGLQNAGDVNGGRGSSTVTRSRSVQFANEFPGSPLLDRES